MQFAVIDDTKMLLKMSGSFCSNGSNWLKVQITEYTFTALLILFWDMDGNIGLVRG